MTEPEHIHNHFESMSTEDLTRLLTTDEAKGYTEEALQIARQMLLDRGVDAPPEIPKKPNAAREIPKQSEDVVVEAKSTKAQEAAKRNTANYVIFSVLGLVAVGPLGYYFADGNLPWVLLPAALFWGFWRISRGVVLTGLLWAGLSFLLLAGLFGMPYHFVAQGIRDLTDPARLTEIAEQHPKKRVRREAIRNKNIEDEALFLRVVQSDPSSEVRRAALMRITDNEALTNFALNNTDPEVRKAAVGKISDKATLEQIQDSDKVRFVRNAAKARLSKLAD